MQNHRFNNPHCSRLAQLLFRTATFFSKNVYKTNTGVEKGLRIAKNHAVSYIYSVTK